MYVLVGADHFEPEQHDEPAGINPNHENRKSGQRPVDGVVFGNADLEMDVSPLRQLPYGAGDYPSDQRRPETHPGVGNEYVEEYQRQPDSYIGRQLEQE